MTAASLRRRGPARIRRLASLAVTFVLSVVYLWLGTTAHPPGVFGLVADSTTHSFGYGLLAVMGRTTALAWGAPAPALWGAGYAIIHGALLELAQSLGDARRAELRDLGWDAVGIGVAIALMAGVRRIRCAC